MKRTYEVRDPDKRAIREFLKREGQFLFRGLVEQTEVAIDEV